MHNSFGRWKYMKRTRCDTCGRFIPKERLEAMPGTHRCIDCARKLGTDVQGKKADISMDPETYKDLLGATRS